MPTIYKLILRSFLGPFVATFFVTLLILLIQFLFKYIDDLAGKGLDAWIILELMFYASTGLVSLALPLSMLLSSLMTFGNLSERYELVALKSAGVSLRKIMMPLFFMAISLSIVSFYFANIVVPWSNLKRNALLYDVQQKKPAFNITEGVFYNGLDGYSIRVGKKLEDGKKLENIMIYDHTADRGNISVILAESGSMSNSEDKRYMILKLENGIQYEEQASEDGLDDRKKHIRVRFKEQEVKFNLSSFDLSRTNEDLFKDNFRMLNVDQLIVFADSFQRRVNEIHAGLYDFIGNYFRVIKQGERMQSHSVAIDGMSFDAFRNTLPTEKRANLNRAMTQARNIKSRIDAKTWEADRIMKRKVRHLVEVNLRFTLSFACVVLFLLGAPLGAIIRKGGIGVPVVISVFFFITFHILSLSFEKLARELVVPVLVGMWTPTAILLPIGIFITYKATTDSTLLDLEAWQRFTKRFNFIKKKKTKSESSSPLQ